MSEMAGEISYGFWIWWKPVPDQTSEVRVSNCSTLAEARELAMQSATRMGYSTPRWWQYWRWNEPDYSMPLSPTDSETKSKA